MRRHLGYILKIDNSGFIIGSATQDIMDYLNKKASAKKASANKFKDNFDYIDTSIPDEYFWKEVLDR